MTGRVHQSLGRNRRVNYYTHADNDAEMDRIHKAAREARKTMAERGELPQYNVRVARLEDLPLITEAWLTSYAYSPVAEAVAKDVYRVEQRDRVRRLVVRSKLLCAVDPEKQDRIKAWVCFEVPAVMKPGRFVILHYVSVHPSLQNMGLGRELVTLARSLNSAPDDPLWTTHMTYPMRRLMDRWNLIYNPYLLEVKPDDPA